MSIDLLAARRISPTFSNTAGFRPVLVRDASGAARLRVWRMASVRPNGGDFAWAAFVCS